jgi:hypothetical protein
MYIKLCNKHYFGFAHLCPFKLVSIMFKQIARQKL